MAIHSSTLAWKIPRTEKPDLWASQMALKNPPANAGDVRDAGLIPGSARSPGVENANPLQYSCLEEPDGCRPWSGKESDMTEPLSCTSAKLSLTDVLGTRHR